MTPPKKPSATKPSGITASGITESDKNKPLSQIKTGTFNRQMALFKTSVVVGSGLAGSTVTGLFKSKEKREASRKKSLSKQANYLALELGKLKGSVVKIGQMMGLLGQHFLPPEVTEALNTLANQTTAIEWPVIEKKLQAQLGERFQQLTIDETPIGSASLAQVHKARINATGDIICLKVLYPGISDVIDSDINAVVRLLKISRLIPISQDFNDWVEEIRGMLKREVDYSLECENIVFYGQKLADDPRFAVPILYPEFCHKEVIAMSFEAGHDILAANIEQLPQARRNALALALTDLSFKEIFEWDCMQTDPNFGNFLVRENTQKSHAHDPDDILVLLDFGSIRPLEKNILDAGKAMLIAAVTQDKTRMVNAINSLNFFAEDAPPAISEKLADVCFVAAEILAHPNNIDIPPELLNANGDYLWGHSDLPQRITKKASKYAVSKHFSMPPAELMFLIRKFVGVFTFLNVIHAETTSYPLIERYIDSPFV